MKELFSLKGRRTRGAPVDAKGAIRVYRRHAARALAEERWCVAEIFINRIIETAPSHTEAWLTKGWIRQYGLSDEATALECYRKVIELCGYDRTHPHRERAQRAINRIVAAAV